MESVTNLLQQIVIPEYASVEQGRCHLGEILGLDDPVPQRVLLTALTDSNYAHNLLVRRGSREELLAFIQTSTAAVMPQGRDRDNRELLISFREAMLRWARIYFTVVDAETRARRTTACEGCEHYSDAPATLLYRIAEPFRSGPRKICGLCGCLLSKKILMPAERCPSSPPFSGGPVALG